MEELSVELEILKSEISEKGQFDQVLHHSFMDFGITVYYSMTIIVNHPLQNQYKTDLVVTFFF